MRVILLSLAAEDDLSGADDFFPCFLLDVVVFSLREDFEVAVVVIVLPD